MLIIECQNFTLLSPTQNHEIDNITSENPFHTRWVQTIHHVRISLLSDIRILPIPCITILIAVATDL